MIIDNVEYSEIKPNKSSTKLKVDYNPSLQGGYSLIYDNSILVDLKYIDYQRNIKHVGSKEKVNVKIYAFGNKPNVTQFKFQMDSPNDPFFNVVFQCNQNKFQSMKNKQGLNNQFQQFGTIIIKCFNKIQEANGKLNAGVTVSSDGKTNLSITQTSEFKNIEIINFDLIQQGDDNLQQKISHKYRNLKKKISLTQERLAKINQIIRQKNPSLLLQIHKGTH